MKGDVLTKENLPPVRWEVTVTLTVSAITSWEAETKALSCISRKADPVRVHGVDKPPGSP